jgi:predicted phage tail protein
VPDGVYFIRVRAKRGSLISVPSNEVSFGVGTGGCIMPPPAPTAHAASPSGLSVTLSWNPSVGATTYVLEAGSGAGQSNLFNANVGSATTLSSPAPAGTYFTRVRAVNACGTSAPSNEVQFVLACAAPAVPGMLTFSKASGLLTLSWGVSAGVTTYRLQAGTSSGASNVFDGPVGAGTSIQFALAGIPPGTYFIRVLATNSCGTSGASNEITVPIP